MDLPQKTLRDSCVMAGSRGANVWLFSSILTGIDSDPFAHDGEKDRCYPTIYCCECLHVRTRSLSRVRRVFVSPRR
jgi:hypothetical protein